MSTHTHRTSKGGCPVCGAAAKDQHSNRESGICNAKKRIALGQGRIDTPEGPLFIEPHTKKGGR